jgi:hypothetical protein
VCREASRGSKSDDTPPSADAVLAAWAARRHGLVTSAQFAAAGLSPGAISHRVATGRLHRHYRGVYSVGHAHLSPEGRWLAAGDGAALSHVCAGKHIRIWRGGTDGIDVVAPRRRNVPGVRIHFCRRPDRRDVTTRNRIPITTVPRTLIDLTDVLTAHQFANVIHEAQYRNRYNPRAVEAAMARANGRPNLKVLEHAIALNNQGSAGTRSAAEDHFLTQLSSSDLPPPLVNQKIEVDFHRPDQNLVVELDGPGHDRPRTQRDDEARDRALARRGIEVVRIRAGGTG